MEFSEVCVSVRCVGSIMSVIGAAALLGGCALRDPYVNSTLKNVSAGNWKIETQKDRITGVAVPNAYVIATASNSSADWAEDSSLQLTCFDGKPMVRLAFKFKVGTDNNSFLGYRFDDKPGHDNVNVRFLQLYQSVVIEDRDEVARFAADLAGSKTLAIRIRSINAGRTTAEFPIDGSAEALAAGFAGCPVTPTTAIPVANKPRARASS